MLLDTTKLFKDRYSENSSLEAWTKKRNATNWGVRRKTAAKIGTPQDYSWRFFKGRRQGVRRIQVCTGQENVVWLNQDAECSTSNEKKVANFLPQFAALSASSKVTTLDY
jgi:hypothetical protein